MGDRSSCLRERREPLGTYPAYQVTSGTSGAVPPAGDATNDTEEGRAYSMYIGIDIAKASFEAGVQEGEEGAKWGRFTNDAAGFEALTQRIAQEEADPSQVYLVVEPTGGYELALVVFGRAKGWNVCLVNPRKVREWAKGMGWRAKTDGQDALKLSGYGAARRPVPQEEMPANVQELDSLLRRKDDLEKMIREERNRQQSPQAPGLSGSVSESIDRVLEALTQELARVNEVIEKLLASDTVLQEDLQRLRQVPGIGERNAPYLLVFLYRWEAVSRGEGGAKELTAYTGIDPQPYESGTSVRRHGGISRMGNSGIRQRLYMSALGGVRGNNPLREFYQGLVGRSKPKKVALVAASRKILVWAWAVFSRKVDFDPARACAMPTPVA